jgi:UDP:flavonoid glycosyltransferase YjiC (YdhE family)
MPTVGLVIGHGGRATTMYALADGLPLVADPQHHIDQPIVAHQVAAQARASRSRKTRMRAKSSKR